MWSGIKGFHIWRKSVEVDGVVEVMLRERGWFDKIQEGRIFNVWESVVGKPIAAQTNPVSLKRGVLHVEVAHPVYANALSLMKPEILSKIANKLEDMSLKSRVSSEKNRVVDVQFRLNPNVAKMKTTKDSNGNTSESVSELPERFAESVSPEIQEQIEVAISIVNDLELRDALKTLFITQCNQIKETNKYE